MSKNKTLKLNFIFVDANRPQDNLEFLQWIMHYHEVNGGSHQDYNATERRRASCTSGKFLDWAGPNTGASSGIGRAQRDQNSAGNGSRRPHMGGTTNSNPSAYPNRAPAQGLNRSAKQANDAAVEQLRNRHSELVRNSKLWKTKIHN